jgi:hypothetical protein
MQKHKKLIEEQPASSSRTVDLSVMLGDHLRVSPFAAPHE